MKAIQIVIGSMWIVVMYVLSSNDTLGLFLTFGTAFIFLVVFSVGGDNNNEPVKAKKISIQYKDGKKETCVGTEWSRYDDVLSIYNNELEDNLVKEISLDVVKSVGFALVATGEGEGK